MNAPAFDYGSAGFNPNSAYAGGAVFPPLTAPPPVSGGNGGMFDSFGNFLNSGFMSNVGGPLLSAGLSGIFTNQAAKNYGQSAYQASAIGALAGKNAALMDFGFGNRNADLQQQRRQKDAMFQLNMQKSKPFQDLATKSFGMQMAAQDSPGAMPRAGRFMTMFG